MSSHADPYTVDPTPMLVQKRRRKTIRCDCRLSTDLESVLKHISIPEHIYIATSEVFRRSPSYCRACTIPRAALDQTMKQRRPIPCQESLVVARCERKVQVVRRDI